MTTTGETLTVGEVARLAGISAVTVYRRVETGRLPSPVSTDGVARWNRIEVESAISEEQDLVTTQDVMRILGVSRPTVFAMVNDGRLPQPHKRGNSNCWLRRDVGALAADGPLRRDQLKLPLSGMSVPLTEARLAPPLTVDGMVESSRLEELAATLARARELVAGLMATERLSDAMGEVPAALRQQAHAQEFLDRGSSDSRGVNQYLRSAIESGDIFSRNLGGRESFGRIERAGNLISIKSEDRDKLAAALRRAGVRVRNYHLELLEDRDGQVEVYDPYGEESLDALAAALLSRVPTESLTAELQRRDASGENLAPRGAE